MRILSGIVTLINRKDYVNEVKKKFCRAVLETYIRKAINGRIYTRGRLRHLGRLSTT